MKRNSHIWKQLYKLNLQTRRSFNYCILHQTVNKQKIIRPKETPTTVGHRHMIQLFKSIYLVENIRLMILIKRKEKNQ